MDATLERRIPQPGTRQADGSRGPSPAARWRRVPSASCARPRSTATGSSRSRTGSSRVPRRKAEPTLILRHDVDQHPRSALRMASIETKLGLRSSWYFRWRTAHPGVVGIAEATIGFQVGLHYETMTRIALERGLHEEPSDGADRELPRSAARRARRLRAALRALPQHGAPRGLSNSRGAQRPVAEGTRTAPSTASSTTATRRCGAASSGSGSPTASAAEGGWMEGIDPLREACSQQELADPHRSSIRTTGRRAPASGSTGCSALRCPAGPSATVERQQTDSDRNRPAAGMTDRDFTPIADSLRSSVLDFYADRGESLEGAGGRQHPRDQLRLRRAPGDTAAPDAPAQSPGVDSIEGLRLIDLGCGFGALSVFFAGRRARS